MRICFKCYGTHIIDDFDMCAYMQHVKYFCGKIILCDEKRLCSLAKDTWEKLHISLKTNLRLTTCFPAKILHQYLILGC